MGKKKPRSRLPEEQPIPQVDINGMESMLAAADDIEGAKEPAQPPAPVDEPKPMVAADGVGGVMELAQPPAPANGKARGGRRLDKSERLIGAIGSHKVDGYNRYIAMYHNEVRDALIYYLLEAAKTMDVEKLRELPSTVYQLFYATSISEMIQLISPYLKVEKSEVSGEVAPNGKAVMAPPKSIEKVLGMVNNWIRNGHKIIEYRVSANGADFYIYVSRA